MTGVALIPALLALCFLGLSTLLQRLSRRLDARIARGSMPSLYPALSDAALSEVFDAKRAQALQGDTIVMVTPLHAEDVESAKLGRAFSEILRRDLMLVRGVSTRGAEDSPSAPCTSVDALAQLAQDGQWVIGGEARFDAGKLRITLWLVSGEKRWAPQTFEDSDPTLLLRRALDHLIEPLWGRLDALSEEGLRHGRPSSMTSLLRLGDVLSIAVKRRRGKVSSDEDLDVEALALDLLEEEPQLAVLHSCLNAPRLGALLELYKHDPFDAGLCFQLYGHIWRGRGFQRDALQFVRRGLELSPSLGKLNMVAPHAALIPAKMGHHSELGYRMLPDNSFAASNYSNWLTEHARDFSKVVEVARAAIDRAPADPANYQRLMDAYESLSDFKRACEVGNELLRWLSPQIHPRTRYCLYQNPITRQRIESGQEDPAATLRARLQELETRAKNAEAS